MRSKPSALFRGVIVLCAGTVAHAQDTQRPAPDPDGTQHTEPLNLNVPILDGPEMPVQADAGTIAFLDELSSVDIHALQSALIATRFFEFADTQTRKGDLYYTSTTNEAGDVVRRFGAYFNTLFVDTFNTPRKEPHNRAYVFDGRMFIEIDEDTQPHLFKQREVIGPGQRLDPMSLEQGFFPLPIGQKRDEILKRYNARLAPVGESLMIDREKAANWGDREIAFFHALAKYRGEEKSVQVVLEPRNDLNDEMRQIRLWYTRVDAGERSAWLPVLVRTIDRSGDVSIIQLMNPTINTSAIVPEDKLSLQPPKDPSGWTVTPIERYREAIVNTPDSLRE